MAKKGIFFLTMAESDQCLCAAGVPLVDTARRRRAGTAHAKCNI